MLKRLIANWLTSISEREFDIPFRLLLEVEGHQAIGHSTIHGPMELGKDIVSWHPEEQLFYFFQMKAGDAKLNDWNDMERQIRQLVEVPYTHPNYVLGSAYQPVWVCTGQLDETVRLSLGRKNDEHRQIGKPPIVVWERNQLIDKFEAAFFDVVFVDDYLLVDFLRVWSHARDFLSDEDNLREFFHHYLLINLSDKKREITRELATYVLIMAQLTQRYVNLDDVYSAIDCLLLGMIQLYDFIITQNTPEQLYKSSFAVLEVLIGFHLQNLVDDCALDPSAINELSDARSGLSEMFEFPLRTHSLASKFALSILLKSLWHQNAEKEANLLENLVKNNIAGFCHIITERQMGTLWLTILALTHLGVNQLVEQIIVNTLDWYLSFHFKDGLLGLPDPYQPYKVVVNHHLGIEAENFRLINMKGESYLLPILLKFFCHLNLRYYIARKWSLISHMIVREHHPQGLQDFFSYRSERGVTRAYLFPIEGSWKDIQKHFSQQSASEFRTFNDVHPESALILALVYPWRTQWRETDRYI